MTKVAAEPPTGFLNLSMETELVAPDQKLATRPNDDAPSRQRIKRWLESRTNVYTFFLVFWFTYHLPTSLDTAVQEFCSVDTMYAFYVVASVLACGCMQVMLPVALLKDWVYNGNSFWDLFRLVPSTAAAPWPPPAAPASPGLSHLGLPPPLPPFVSGDGHVHQHAWLRVCKGSVATYVLWLILFRDTVFALELLNYSTHICYTFLFKAVMVAQSLMYSAIAVLVYFVTLVLIARSTTISDTILSGVGALFILEFDEVVAYMFQDRYLDKMEEMLDCVFANLDADVRAELADKMERGGAAARAIAPAAAGKALVRRGGHRHLPLFILNVTITYVSIGFWIYFLYRLQRG